MREINDLDTHIRRVFDPAFLVQRINFVLRRAVVEGQQRSRVQAVLWDRADDGFYRQSNHKQIIWEATGGIQIDSRGRVADMGEGVRSC